MFRAPIRTDVVNFVHTNVRKNKRRPYAVSREAGMFLPYLFGVFLSDDSYTWSVLMKVFDYIYLSGYLNLVRFIFCLVLKMPSQTISFRLS